MADAAGLQANEHLAGSRLGELELLHLEGLAESLQHGCADLHERDPMTARLPAVALHGSCQCGGVRFEVPDHFEPRAFCHCTTCKKLSGGAGTANGRLRSEEVTILEGEELLRTYQPEEGTAKTFCSVCGSNLFGGGWPESDQASVRLSAIDDPLPGQPAKHIYTRSLATWETLPDDGLEQDAAAG